MLNFTNDQKPAVLHYGSSDFMILENGSYVFCAVTGDKIPLADLKYWNDDAQEAYIDAKASLSRWQELHP